jgi:Do/DeqQ family serine protease
MKRFTGLLFVSLLSGTLTLGGYKLFVEKDAFTKASVVTSASSDFTKNTGLSGEAIDFIDAADKAVHNVVHVKNVSVRTVYNPIMEYFYGSRGGQQQEQIGTGSGVIISEDGYIVTNNHVIKDANQLEVTLNNKKVYQAKLIGTDSKMDIALLKIDADEKLPFSTFADSDQVKVGEWVLAVGNPYNLTSTVTAGIVSAKARNLGTDGIQSFIQTDAAVNPGNSGGALVNTKGQLIGINTLISSPTGSYAGYSFAIPSNITRKIIEDLMEYGSVKRGMLGIEVRELNGAVSKDLGLKETQGVYVTKVETNSGASKAGLSKGDVIVKLDGRNISSFSEFSGYINTKRPDDKIAVTILRNGASKVLPVTLANSDLYTTELNGIEIGNIENTDKKRFNITYGVKIIGVNNAKYKAYEAELIGSIILKVNGTQASDVETVTRIIGNSEDDKGVNLELITKTGQVVRIII